MRIKDKGVSPIIGSILLVLLTLVLFLALSIFVISLAGKYLGIAERAEHNIQIALENML